MHSRVSSLQVIRRGSASFPLFSRIAPCRKLRLRIGTATAFVVPRADGDFDLRWFTPKVEDDLCGHATLASAYVLALRKHNVWPVRFHTRSGILTVAQNQDSFEMDFPARPPQPCETPVDLLPALGLNTAQVMKSRDYLVVVDDAEQVRA